MPAPTIESHANNKTSGGTTTTIAVTAAGANRVIVVCATISQGSGSVNPTLTIAGGGANVGPWTSIGSTGPSGVGYTIQAWYTVTTGAVSAAVVTITSNLTIDDTSTAYVTVAGANVAKPLDQNPTLATGASNGGTAFNHTTNQFIQWAISTNTVNVLAFGFVGGNGNQAYGFALANSTLTETNLNNGGALFANIGVYTAPFTTQQTNTAIGSSAGNSTTVSGLAFAVTADSQAAAPRLPIITMVM